MRQIERASDRARFPRRRLVEVVQGNRELISRRLDDGCGAIARTVVDDDDLVVGREALTREMSEAIDEEHRAVVRGDDDADSHACAALTPAA